MSADRKSLARIARLQGAMKAAGVDFVVLGPFANLFYLCGSALPDTARFNCVVIPQAAHPTYVVPKIQAALVPRGFDAILWEEDETPFDAVAGVIANVGRVAVDPRMRSAFLIGLQRVLPGVSFEDAAPITSGLRTVKDHEDLEILAQAGRKFDAIWSEFFADGRLIGRSELDVRRQISQLILAHGFESVAWCDVGSGPNGASPLHHGSERIIQPGDPVVIDFAGVYQGFFMDTCRTPIAGTPAPEFLEIYHLVNQAYEAAEAAARPGLKAHELDAVARNLIEAGGYGKNFLHRLGHGLGLDPHEAPFIVSGNDQILEPGMVFSNEPGIYIPGRWGVRIENILALTESGVRRFGNTTRAVVQMN